ncbi:hypothetical protein BDV18DRAFT_88464 [Aspergillus unguis]
MPAQISDIRVGGGLLHFLVSSLHFAFSHFHLLIFYLLIYGDFGMWDIGLVLELGRVVPLDGLLGVLVTVILPVGWFRMSCGI